MKWLRKDRPTRGRLPSLGQDYGEAHRRVRLACRRGRRALAADEAVQRSSRAMSSSSACATFSHIVARLGLGLRAQVLDVGCGPGLAERVSRPVRVLGHRCRRLRGHGQDRAGADCRDRGADRAGHRGARRVPRDAGPRAAVERAIRCGDPLRRDAPLRRRGGDASRHPPHARARRSDLHPRGRPPRAGLPGRAGADRGDGGSTARSSRRSIPTTSSRSSARRGSRR